MTKEFKILFAIAIMTFLIGCSPKMLPLKGTYINKPYEITSDKSFDAVWSNMIDLFATKGLSIKVIDKNSGLIVSEKTSLISNYTIEDDNGKLIDPNAWIVISKINWMGTEVIPDRLTAEWNVRIKSNVEGKTIINVNLTNIDGSKYYAPTQYTAAQNFKFDGRSTGIFEKTIADQVK
jgi:hypothetical protein